VDDSRGITQEIHTIVHDLQASVAIGIHGHERLEKQRIYVNIELVGRIPLRPETIADCMDYDHIHALVVGEWPNRTHTELLETLLIELVDFCFTNDSKLTAITASITKPDIFKEAARVGVKIHKTRAAWLIEKGHK